MDVLTHTTTSVPLNSRQSNAVNKPTNNCSIKRKANNHMDGVMIKSAKSNPSYDIWQLFQGPRLQLVVTKPNKNKTMDFSFITPSYAWTPLEDVDEVI